VPRTSKTLSIGELAKHGRFDELGQRILAGERANLAAIFERAVTDFRTVRRNPGHLAILEWCIDQGLDLDARAGWLNQSIFCLAAAAGNNELVAYMLRKKPADNPFAWASLGEVELLASHASGRDLSELQDENGFNLLFNCAQSGLGRRDPEVKQRLTRLCRLLVDRGVSPRHEVNFGVPISPAFLCAASGGNAEIMRLLLDNGGLTAELFHLAIEHCLEPHQRSGEPFYDVADCILGHGFDVNTLSADARRSLLHGAANRGTIKAVKWLLAKGADPNRLDGCGRTPLHVCAQRNTSAAVARLLIGAGAEPQAVDSAGKTALDHARENDRTKTVEYLESIGSR
jgi:Ankyrin repeats (3 copies)